VHIQYAHHRSDANHSLVVAKETEEYSTGRTQGDSVARALRIYFGAAQFALVLPKHCILTLGRDDGVSLELMTSSVSRVHAEIEVRLEDVLVRDRGSRNGTFLNGAKVPSDQSVPFHFGDEMRLGDAVVSLFRVSHAQGALLTLFSIDALSELGLSELAVVELARPAYEQAELMQWVGRFPDIAVALKSPRILVLAHAQRQRLEEGLASLPCVRSVRFKRDTSNLALQIETVLRSAKPIPAVLSADPKTKSLEAEADRIAASKVTILIQGETGTGKEVLARRVHLMSGRPGALVAVNAAALPENLIESELFGYERGAFSGAQQAKIGLIEAADQGTLLLDEIGELPLPLQAKLLRVLEDNRVRRLGATVDRTVDIRWVAATHCDLRQAVAAKTFREDLYYRLNVCTLFVSPLRERPLDIRKIGSEFLSRLGAPAVAEDVWQALEGYAWPGNVRELRNVFERAVALAGGGAITLAHLPEEVCGPRGHMQNDAGAPELREQVRDVERERIVQALAEFGGNQTRAAERLGLPRRTLAYRMAKLGIKS
jgi:two-component system, NtrC family, response regulator AtoC